MFGINLSTKVHRLPGIYQPFHQSTGREGSPPVPAHEEDHFFEWNDKADEAFLQLKKMLTTPPVLAAPTAEEPMLLYITATSRVVSTVIVLEHKEEGKALPVQRPVYYLSEVLSAS